MEFGFLLASAFSLGGDHGQLVTVLEVEFCEPLLVSLFGACGFRVAACGQHAFVVIVLTLTLLMRSLLEGPAKTQPSLVDELFMRGAANQAMIATGLCDVHQRPAVIHVEAARVESLR